LNKKSRP